MNSILRILILEDVETDAELALNELRKTGLAFEAERVETAAAFLTALEEGPPGLILADYHLPTFDGLRALEMASQTCPMVPFLFVTGVMGEDVAVETLKRGATDYILKDRLSRLGPAVQRALEEAKEKKRRCAAEEALKESEEKFRRIAAAAQDALVIIDGRGRITDWNLAAERMFQYRQEAVIGCDLHDLLVSPSDSTACRQGLANFLETGNGPVIGRTIELAARKKDGSNLPIELSVSAVRLKGEWHAIGLMRDISERRRAEKALFKVNRALKTLSNCNEALVRAEGESELIENMCRILVEAGGYLSAWVSFARPDGSLEITTRAGQVTDKLDGLTLQWEGPHTPESLAGMAVSTGEMHVQQGAGQGASDVLLEAAASRIGSAVSLPLLDQDDVFGALTIYAAETNAFQQEELLLLEELAGDLAFGIATLRVRNAHEQDREKLERSMHKTVQAIANTVEMRDPYTAGHQRRVAQLAVAIAKELGVEAARMRGLHLAGIVHDIGKIQIPTEILSKPGRLSDVEFRFIQLHAQAGFEILKDVEFPWPIADIVRQHHERINGTGYPQGLKGDEILLEARILSVADVVEAMASHRPYRPGLGLEAAFAEITRQRGLGYDPAVVDACFTVFERRNFAFN